MSAGGRGARKESELRACVTHAAEGRNVQLEWVRTQAPEHAIALAEEAVTDGCQLVVAVGGDGTVSEVVNGLMRAGQQGNSTTLGIIPVGSGNDFAWLAGIPMEPSAACQRLFEGQTRLVDIGHILEASGRERYFDNGCGIGFDAVVSVEARRLKWLRGYLIYVVAVLKTLIFHHQAPRLRIQVDGRELINPTMMLTIGNGQRHGGVFFVTPDAKLDDGLLEVCIAGEFSRPGMLMILPSFMRGTHVTHKKIQMDRARKITMEAPVPQAIHTDGEIFATDARQCEVTVIPRALRLRV
jgi:YegS/Rv2252/BmrU family lipid kinase